MLKICRKFTGSCDLKFSYKDFTISFESAGFFLLVHFLSLPAQYKERKWTNQNSFLYSLLCAPSQYFCPYKSTEIKKQIISINICSTHSLTAKNGWSLRNSPTSCFVHTESNSHLSAITRCPYLRVYLIDYRHPELVSGSQYLTHYTIIKNNYGQLRQMDAHRYSNNFL